MIILPGASSLRGATWTSEYAQSATAYARGDYVEAELHSRAALDAAATLPQNDSQLEATLNQLAAVLEARGLCCEAEGLMRRALAIRQTRFPEDSTEVAQVRSNLASVLREEGHTEEAGRLASQALETGERHLDPRSPDLVPLLAIAGLTQMDSHHLGLAVQLLERGRGIAESNSAADPRRLAQVLRYLGLVYRSAGRLDDAERVYRQALELAIVQFGERRADTALATIDAACGRRRCLDRDGTVQFHGTER